MLVDLEIYGITQPKRPRGNWWARSLAVLVLCAIATLTVPNGIHPSHFGSLAQRSQLEGFTLPAAFEATIHQYAWRYGLDPALLTAIIQVESSFNPLAVSNKGALGLMQLMPRTASSLDVTDPMDPQQNILGGAKQMRYLLDRFGDNLEFALAAYHAGVSRVLRHEGIPPYSSTQTYVKNVLRTYRNLQALPEHEL
ncbi:hypothetical protein YTPLAS18_37830 [Nitrospira sp.]|nr:hypothetical protein YTPLAS18_37830 [Nitrospira sp.]